MKSLIPILLACLCLTACHKDSTSRGFLANDLSYKLICPDSIPTDEVYSWWSESAKQSWIEYGNEPKEDRWFILPEPLGFRGADFQRFYIHYDTVYKVSDSIYHIDGRTRCKDEICTISGSLIVDSVVPLNDTLFSVDDFTMFTGSGTLYAHYTLQANHNDKHIADLVGKACFDYLIHNDTGDFRIPESNRLDGGCGVFIPYEEFYNNGWKTYIDWDRHGWIADPEHAYYDSIYQADINWWK